ncbi:MAG: peptidylprolyl isomerase [Nitrospinota bacterium]|nr:MAG: peptidylprolyl isomerase [Nitrospinota bacterium]
MKVWSVIACLTLAFGIVGLIPPVWGAAPASSTDVVAVVNGVSITSQELDNEFLSQTRVPFAMVQDNPQAQQIRKRILDQLIDRQLLIQEARRQKLAVDAKTVEEQFQHIRSRFPSEEAFQQVLEARGLTEEKLKENIQEELLRQQIIQKEILDKVSTSPDELKTFFQQHKEQYAQKEEVRARHILIKVAPNASAEEDQKAKERAQEILKRAQKGEDFAELAKQYSEGPSKERGGDLGYFTRGKMVKPFEDAAFKLGVGEISDLVKSQFGYHIIKVEDKKEAKALSYEEAKTRVKDDLTREKAIALYQSYIEKLRQKGEITINLK